MMKKDMAAASLDSQRRGCRGLATLVHPRYLLTMTGGAQWDFGQGNKRD